MADIDDLKQAEEALETSIHNAVQEIVSLHTQLDSAVKNNNMDQVRAVTARLMASNEQLRAVAPPPPDAPGQQAPTADQASSASTTAPVGATS